MVPIQDEAEGAAIRLLDQFRSDFVSRARGWELLWRIIAGTVIYLLVTLVRH
jgi:hypothetical protein